MRQILFLVVVAVFAAGLAGIAVAAVMRTRNASRKAWKILMTRLQNIDREKFAVVALDLLEEDETQTHLDPEAIFEMVDGMNGLDKLEENCDVLIDLTMYVQKWYPDALQIAEELRLNAREIQWHIGRLRGAARTGHMREQFPQYAQRAVATYYLMTRSVLVLYEGMQLPEFAELQAAI